MLKNLIPFLQHFDKLILVRTCSQQVRQISLIMQMHANGGLKLAQITCPSNARAANTPFCPKPIISARPSPFTSASSRWKILSDVQP